MSCNVGVTTVPPFRPLNGTGVLPCPFQLRNAKSGFVTGLENVIVFVPPWFSATSVQSAGPFGTPTPV